MTTILQRIDEIKAYPDYLLVRYSLDRVEPAVAIVTIDYWLKRTQGATSSAQLFTERHIVENHNEVDEKIYLDDTKLGSLVRSKKW